MIYITQLIYILDGKEQAFIEFENHVIPIIARYNGILQLRVRPDENAFVEYAIDKPYEIHLVQFESRADFENFMKDETRKQFLHLKEESIKSSILILGTKL